MAELITLLWAVLGAAVFAAVFYLKAWATTNPPEPFVPEKFLATLIVGAAIGLILWLGNSPITSESVLDQLGDYALFTGIIESILKVVLAKLGITWPGNAPPPTPTP